jgi:hypothetical protein
MEYLASISETNRADGGILTITHMAVDDNQPEPASIYKKTWIDGVCQDCNTPFHTWAFL